MRIPRVYLSVPLSVGGHVVLDREQCHYLATVLRLKLGRPLIIFNGDGAEYTAELDTLQRHAGMLRVVEKHTQQRESPLAVTLAQGVSRGERMSYALQKAVELGVAQIQPIISEHCEVRLDEERTDKRHHHWHGIVVSACEQSGRLRLPALARAQSLQTWLATLASPTPQTLRLVLDPRGQDSLGLIAGSPHDLMVLVGPEGGLSTDEVKHAQTHGFVPVRLGPRTLRTETAAAAALSVVQLRWGDLG
jgi:16S rRNA (uracil1498-N3)-methyltransferase